jgi:hypothetical protein
VSICYRTIEGVLLKAVSGSRRVWIFHYLYKRLGEVTKSAWLFFFTEVVSAQVLRQRNSNIHPHLALSRSATP